MLPRTVKIYESTLVAGGGPIVTPTIRLALVDVLLFKLQNDDAAATRSLTMQEYEDDETTPLGIATVTPIRTVGVNATVRLSVGLHAIAPGSGFEIANILLPPFVRFTFSAAATGAGRMTIWGK